MLIFVEGIDKSGKTTFIKELSRITSIPMYRKYLPRKISDAEFHSYFKGIGYATVELSKILDFDLIVDRCFISDWIYSNRYSDNYNLEIWQEWESVFNAGNSLILYFTVSKDTFTYRIKNTLDIYMDKNDYDRYMKLYSTYFNHTNIPVLEINGEFEFDRQLEILKSYLLDEERFFRTTLYQKLVI